MEKAIIPDALPATTSAPTVSLKTPSTEHNVHDTFRYGFKSAKTDILPSHPLEQSEANYDIKSDQFILESLRFAQGLQAPLKLQLERRMASRIQRIPPLQSSMIALETLLGKDTFLSPEELFDRYPIASPISTLKDALSWQPGCDNICVSSVPLHPRSVDPFLLPNVLVCHDVMGGYTNDRYVQALELVINQHGLSTARFAPGWVFENNEKFNFIKNNDRSRIPPLQSSMMTLLGKDTFLSPEELFDSDSTVVNGHTIMEKRLKMI